MSANLSMLNLFVLFTLIVSEIYVSQSLNG